MIYNIKTYLFSIIYFLFISTNCFAQYNDDFLAPRSFENLGDYGTIPVSYFTGMMDLQVPILSTNILGIPLDVKIIYDNSGIKINQLPGCIGHNWTLSAGGTISRITNGLFDDIDENNNFKNIFHSYKSFNDILLGKTNGDGVENNRSRRPESLSYGSLINCINNRHLCEDLSPDYYIFNFMGKHGLFFLGSDGYWKVCCDDYIDVVFDYEDPTNFELPFINTYPGNNKPQPKSIKGFTLIDENGIKYIFGTTPFNPNNNSIDYSIPFSGIGENETSLYWVPQRWHLSVIQDRFGNNLYKFSYKRGPFASHLRLNCFYNKTNFTHEHYSGNRRRVRYASNNDSVVNSNINSTTSRQTYSDEVVSGTHAFNPYDITLWSTAYLLKIETLNDEIITFDYSNALSTDKYAYQTAYKELKAKLYTNDYIFSIYDYLATKIKNKGKRPFFYLEDSRFKNYWYKENADKEDPLAVTGLLRLDNISINKGGNIVNNHLNYNNDHLLFHLSSVDINCGDDVQHYSFSYSDWDKLPNDYSSYNVDHYGYFAGNVFADGIPISPRTFHRTSANINGYLAEESFDEYHKKLVPNFCAKYGLLRKITYPTGGCKVFTYQLNEAEKILSQDRKNTVFLIENSIIRQRKKDNETYYFDHQSDKQVDYGLFCGGCRIFSITSYNDIEEKKLSSIRRFKYEEGEVYSFPHFYWKGTLYGLNSCSSEKCEIMSCSPINRIYDLNGFNIGYSKVIEVNSDGSMTKFFFSNISNNLVGMDSRNEIHDMELDVVDSPFEVIGDKSFGRGKLLGFTKTNPYGTPIYRKTISYRNDTTMRDEFAYSLHISLFQGNSNCEQKCVIAAFNGGIKKVYYTKLDTIQIVDWAENMIPLETKFEMQNISYCDSIKHILFNNRLAKTITREWNSSMHKNDQLMSDRTEYDYLLCQNNKVMLDDAIQNKWKSFHCFRPFVTVQHLNGQYIGKQILNVGDNNTFNIKDIYNFYPDGSSEKNIQIYEYNKYGLPIKLQKLGDTFIHINYKNLNPVAVIRSNNSPSFDNMKDPFHIATIGARSIFEIPCTEAVIATYDTSNNVASITKDCGMTEYYQYDGLGRLTAVFDMKRKIKKQFSCTLQNNGLNYIKSITFLDEYRTNTEKFTSYYDGFGKNTIISWKSIDGNKDLFGLTEYDMMGRVSKKFNPIATSKDVKEASSCFADISKEYYNDNNAFFSINYDYLGRVSSTTRAGNAWQNRNTNFAYDYCRDREVKRYCTTVNIDSLTFDWFKANDLAIFKTLGENGDYSEVYKDYLGRLILERKYIDSNKLDTYYVYNEIGQLTYVLQPNYQKDAKLSLYAFQYKYDNYGNVIEITIPGCDPIKYWYNKKHQIVCMQDGILRGVNFYRFYLYDHLGRLCIQGTSPQCYQQTEFGCISTELSGPIFKNTGYKYLGNQNELIPENCNLEIVNYYDTYNFLKTHSTLIPQESLGLGEYMSPLNVVYGHSHLTGSLIKASNGNMIFNCYSYDEYGRIIGDKEVGVNKDFTNKSYEYTFTGKIKKEWVDYYNYDNIEKRINKKSISTWVENVYDFPNSDLLHHSIFHISSGAGWMIDTIQTLTYDDFGNIVKIDRGGKKADMSYQYDLLHGWVKQIKSNGGFEQNLYRETDGKHPRWDGSISAMSWKTDDEYIRRYDYTYDELNRLTSAEFGSKVNSLSIKNKVVVPKDSLVRTPIIDNPIIGIRHNSANAVKSLIPETGSSLIAINALDAGTVQNNTLIAQSVSSAISSRYGGDLRLYVASNENYSESVSYDSNSNIISLQRYGDLTSKKDYGLIDDLTITHNGNQLRSVEDQAGGLKYNDALDFVDGKDFDDEYSYNGNGALTMDLNKGIQNIEYDLLGNPVKVTLDRDRIIEYVYAADGRRLRVKHSQVIASLTPAVYGRIRCMTKKVVSDSTDYIGNLILKDGKPSMYQFNGGYYSFNEAGDLDGCHYYVRDYQGNNRMVVSANTDEIEQVTHYYPFGGVMADISTGQDLQKYKYGNKELDRTYGLDLYDFHARQYDAIMPSFTSIDPLAEKNYSFSPYSYCNGDPINYVDKTGLIRIGLNSEGKFKTLDEKDPSSIILVKMTQGQEVPNTEFRVSNELSPVINRLRKKVRRTNGHLSAYATTTSKDVFDLFDWILRMGPGKEWRLDIYNNDGDYLYAFGTDFYDGSVSTFETCVGSTLEQQNRIIGIHNHLVGGTMGPSGLKSNSGQIVDGDLFVVGKQKKVKNFVAVPTNYGSYNFFEFNAKLDPTQSFTQSFNVSFPITGGFMNNWDTIFNFTGIHEKNYWNLQYTF